MVINPFVLFRRAENTVYDIILTLNPANRFHKKSVKYLSKNPRKTLRIKNPGRSVPVETYMLQEEHPVSAAIPLKMFKILEKKVAIAMEIH
jgi:hypothetical protein